MSMELLNVRTFAPRSHFIVEAWRDKARGWQEWSRHPAGQIGEKDALRDANALADMGYASRVSLVGYSEQD